MPYGTVLRRSLFCVVALHALATAPAVAATPSGVQEPANAASSGELAIDRQLARQYGELNPMQQLEPADASLALPAAAESVPANVAVFDEDAARRLEQEIDAALAEAATKKPARKVVREAAPKAWSTAAVVSGTILLFALVCLVLTLAVRELRKDVKQRRRSYRRRVRRRHPPVETAAISAS